jgi:isopentenyldiphosphate isomerase
MKNDDVVVVNEHDQIVGTMPRPDAHRNGTAHRIAVTYVENHVGEIIVQVRSNGSLDHSSAGHVAPGESYAEAAARELAEELGIWGVELAKIGHTVSHEPPSPAATLTAHVFDVFLCRAERWNHLEHGEVGNAFWGNPTRILADMLNPGSLTRYAGGFRASLPIYLTWCGERARIDGLTATVTG